MTGASRPRTRRPLWRWEPGPYLLLLLLVMITGSIDPRYLLVAYIVFVVLTIAAAAVVVATIAAGTVRRRRDPLASGVVRSVERLNLVELDRSDAPATPVIDTYRHRSALEAAQAMTVGSPRALLVPDSARWYGLRLRIAVHLLADTRAYHAGYLPDRSTLRYNAGLATLAASGCHVVAPATLAITEMRRSGGVKRHAVAVDLGALPALLEAAPAAP
jgi:hypothetical protein